MDLEQIKQLRDLTSLGIKDCKKALEESSGDFKKALEILKEKGIQVMEKRSTRLTSRGLIESYVHFGGNLGALVEVNCETDFVARTDVFRKFVKDIVIQIAATNPKYIKRDEVSPDELAAAEDQQDYVKQNCLLEQVFIKDNKITMGEYLRDVISQTGENIVVRRFLRYSLGE